MLFSTSVPPVLASAIHLPGENRNSGQPDGERKWRKVAAEKFTASELPRTIAAVSGRVRSVLLLGQKRSYHGWRFVSLRC
jgi:hypothetical protein